ncbi:MAG: N-acyl homoserine lactonase family protein [Acidobacteriota bacterium]|nr:N-acyl homoserine lactonase family protein [Acidobacteriota bacterium]MDE3170649.1 N-acyl homoserine lactonase family protein [Acidobacteriota bacterium]
MTFFLASGASLAAQHHPPRAPKSVRLYVFDCGVLKGLDPGLFHFTKDQVQSTEMAVPCYLIVDPKGTLMWDVGVIPDTAFKPDGKPVTRGYATVTQTLKSQLEQIGYEPSDITYLAMSHYHSDHTANANEFAASTWLVRKVERDAMFAPKPAGIIDPSTYSELKNGKTIIIDKDEYDVFGDGKVIIKSAPGHTPGHQVLIVKLAKTGTVVVAGDLYHFPEERFSDKTPTFEYNRQQSLASRAMIEAYIKKTGAQLWIEHDFIANSKLKKSPRYYN